MMDPFLDKFIKRLDKLCTDEDLWGLYRWVWQNKAEWNQAVERLNKSLGLKGDCELKPVLPHVSVGSRDGIVLMAANPKWSGLANEREEAHSQKTLDDYLELMCGFFEIDPKIVKSGGTGSKRWGGWWNNGLSFIEDAFPAFYPKSPSGGLVRWQHAHDTRLVGGWDLFPFHSNKDCLSPKIQSNLLVKRIATASFSAAVRRHPKILLAAVSPVCAKAIRHEVASGFAWRNGAGKNVSLKNDGDDVLVDVALAPNGTKVVLVGWQLFANAARSFKNEDVIDAIKRLCF